VAAALATILANSFTNFPSWALQHFRSGSSVSLVVTAEPEFMDDQGLTMATGNGGPLGQQLVKTLSQPFVAGSPIYTKEMNAIGAVYVDELSIRLVVTGESSQGIRIVDIRPISLRRSPPLAGTIFIVPSQAGSVTIPMMFNLDEATPVARHIIKSANEQAQPDPEHMINGFIEGPEPGSPFFDGETITLSKAEQQVLSIRVQVAKFYAAFDLEIDYVIGKSSIVHTMVLANHGQPFQVTGLHSGSQRNTMSYQQAFYLQNNFSLCKLANPRLIPTMLSTEPRCRLFRISSFAEKR